MDAYQKFVNDIINLPIVLEPIYEGNPNKPIFLYKGLLELRQTFTIEQEDGSNEIKEHTQMGCGHVEFTWFPLPCIKFEFSSNETSFWLDVSKPILLRLPSLNASVAIHLSEYNQGKQAGNKVSGRITEPVVQGSGESLAYVMFHIVNFSEFIGSPTRSNKDHIGYKTNRINFEISEENWKLTLDNLQSISECSKELKANGGFAVTHVGKLERLNGDMFSDIEAKDLLGILQSFLSFARGLRVPIILLSGYDNHENKVWEYWDSSQGDSWQGVKSSFPEFDGRGQFIADVFPGFLRWWSDENWKKSVKLILHYYLEANIGSGGAEGALILAQTALELIAYIKVENEFDGNDRAAHKIRKLLTNLGIPENVPPENAQESPALEELPSAFEQALEAFQPNSPPILENLRQVIEKQNSLVTQENQKWQDGPHALTKIRNNIVHAKKDLDFIDAVQISEAQWETLDLGLWYLDVVLLNLFGYQGDYINRLNGKIEPVPRAYMSP
jgi:hypothetical protein